MTLCNVSGTHTRRMREVSSVDAHTVRALSRIARDPSPAAPCWRPAVVDEPCSVGVGEIVEAQPAVLRCRRQGAVHTALRAH